MNNSDDDLHELVQTLRTSFRLWSWLTVLMAHSFCALPRGRRVVACPPLENVTRGGLYYSCAVGSCEFLARAARSSEQMNK